MCKKLTADSILNGKKPEVTQPKSGMSQDRLLSTLLLSIAPEVLAGAKMQGKEMKGTQRGKEEVKQTKSKTRTCHVCR